MGNYSNTKRDSTDIKKYPDIPKNYDQTWVGKYVDPTTGKLTTDTKKGARVLKVEPETLTKIYSLNLDGKWVWEIKGGITASINGGVPVLINAVYLYNHKKGIPSEYDDRWVTNLPQSYFKDTTPKHHKKTILEQSDESFNAVSGDVSSGTVTIINFQDVVKGKVGKFNPPPHKASRSVSPLNWPGVAAAGASATIAKYSRGNHRGFFYQDIDSAFDSKGNPKLKKNLWGFQFMYNPTTFQHTNQANTSIDYTDNQDVANLLTGSQTYTINLLLNRVYDMTALKNQKTGGTADGYPRALTPAEVQGITSRGTEYDLEFLYRVINGEPVKGPSMNQPTADFGYLSGLPLWVRLNDQMRYKGFIANLTVNHVMFTLNMIPMLSEVQITFVRIPTMGYGDTSANIKKTLTTPDGNSSLVPQYTGTGNKTTS